MKEDFKYGKDGRKPGKYPPEIKQQAVELFMSCRGDHRTRKLAAAHVAELLGIGCADTVMGWVIQAERDSGERPGATTEDIEEVRRLRRENAELRRANAILKARIATIHEQNFSCYGVLKMWHTLLNDGMDVGRERVRRLMRELGIKGAARAKTKRTTIAGDNVRSADDLVRRDFDADAPNRLWVADFTYVSTWEGWCYVAFVIDAFSRRILGYDVATRMTAGMVARAFKMAVFARSLEGCCDLADLIHHNDYAEENAKPQNSCLPCNCYKTAA
jgi:transposase-like protein